MALKLILTSSDLTRKLNIIPYTTPTRLKSTVESRRRRRCVLSFRLCRLGSELATLKVLDVDGDMCSTVGDAND